jgi:hypothetical protein
MIKNNSKMLCTSVIDTRCYKFSNIYKSLNNAKFIYISRNIRDSFAVVISREAHILGKSVEERIRFVVNTWGLEVVKAMLAAKHFAASNKELMHLVDFDEMILDTEKCMRNICKWLNIKFDDFMLQATFNGRVISREAVKKVIDSAEKVMSRDNLYLLDKMLDYLLVKANFELFESC